MPATEYDDMGPAVSASVAAVHCSTVSYGRFTNHHVLVSNSYFVSYFLLLYMLHYSGLGIFYNLYS